MIHHISIAAENPLRVAQVLAEIWQGQVAPFPPHPGSYMVLALDEQGTMLEVYPAGVQLMPGSGNGEVMFVPNAPAFGFTATHAAISVPVGQAEIEQIATREGWRAVRCNRDDLFEVIEFWVENRMMIELLTPELAPRYLALMHPANLQQNLEKFLAMAEPIADFEPITA